MPPRTRGVKVPKASKENIDILNKKNIKKAGKSLNPARKPLADKTNSASDENASPGPLVKVVKISTKSSRKIVSEAIDEKRPRRNRRLPTRYVENQVLNNLSNSKDNATTPNKTVNNADKTPVKDASKVKSPFKTPNTVLDSSLVSNRPRRVSRLPSKFDENVSPNKYIPIQPCHTSTPLVQKLKERSSTSKNTSTDKRNVISEKNASQKAMRQKATSRKVMPQKTQKQLVQKKISQSFKQIARSNISGVQQDRVKRQRKPVKYKEVTLSPKLRTPDNSKPKNTAVKKLSQINTSIRVFEEKKTKKGEGQDVYEFTFDPSDEPPPQKKKRKKIANKKPARPKQRVFNNNYEKNLARALADLKNTVAKQKAENIGATTMIKTNLPITDDNGQQKASTTSNKPATAPNISSVVISTTAEIHNAPDTNNAARSNVSSKHHASIRVEDIAADFEATIDHDDNIDYSPVNSPDRIDEPVNTRNVSPYKDTVRSDDPLNLRNDLSFFDDQPVASSSMNISSRNPMATPWRVEFESLPIKWQANTYVKPDMTPALESSYINNFDDSKKKHVYTNMVEDAIDTLPEIVESEVPKLKQTSIISFIKEVVEKNANKKKRVGSGTPSKVNSIMPSTVITPRKKTSVASNKNTSSESDISSEGNKSQKRKHDGDNNSVPAKVARNDNDDTLFGFDDSENQDQENISPVKILNTRRLQTLRSRLGAALKELNKQTGPMRAELPAAMKSKLAPSSETVEKMYDQIKSAADAPALLDKQGDGETTNGLNDEDSQSVHLFEDIELVHHLKPTRKSYGKAKKVTFGQHSSDSGDEAPARHVSSDDDAEDPSFHLPEFKAKKVTKKKKKTKKQLLSKKEKEEVDAWAACFNSMCEDIEEFDLVVE